MFVHWRKKCLALVTVLVVEGATANPTCTITPTEPDWNRVYHSETLSLYEPANPTGLPELVASVQWHILPTALYRVIWDYAQFRQHIPGVRKSKVLLAESGHKWVYQQLEMPEPLKDRHYILESSNTRSLPDQHHYRVEWKLSQRFPLPANNRVIPTAFSGCWDIRAVGNNGLIAQYRIQLDPAGNIPHWIARRGMRGYVTQLIEHLHSQLKARQDGRPD